MKQVVVHKSPRHADDFLALCLLKMVFGEIEVVEVAPQDEKLREFLDSEEVIVLDVGGRCEYEKANFDHHHDLNLTCSLVQIMKWLNYEREAESEFVRGIDIVDRKGPKGLQEVGISGYWDENLDRMRKIILSSDISADLGALFLDVCRRGLSYQDSWAVFFIEAEKKGLLEAGKKKVEEEEKVYIEKKEKVRYAFVKGLDVAVSFQSLSPHHQRFFKETGVDLLVERNIMNPKHTSVIKNTQKDTSGQIDLSKLEKKYPIVFLHKAGFIAVIDMEVESVDVEEIVGVILE